uniref:Uncharacterized protein n=1 Tax=Vespula pensylvanica TaxID=30213 RepID=A0A834JQW3_VESPE|nr:hypothetical protein H0235_017454 [Vespula pensylvanica]
MDSSVESPSTNPHHRNKGKPQLSHLSRIKELLEGNLFSRGSCFVRCNTSQFLDQTRVPAYFPTASRLSTVNFYCPDWLSRRPFRLSSQKNFTA